MLDVELEVMEQEGSSSTPCRVAAPSAVAAVQRVQRSTGGHRTGTLCDVKAREPFPDSTRSPTVQVCHDTWWPEAPLQHLPAACPISCVPR